MCMILGYCVECKKCWNLHSVISFWEESCAATVRRFWNEQECDRPQNRTSSALDIGNRKEIMTSGKKGFLSFLSPIFVSVCLVLGRAVATGAFWRGHFLPPKKEPKRPLMIFLFHHCAVKDVRWYLRGDNDREPSRTDQVLLGYCTYFVLLQ